MKTHAPAPPTKAKANLHVSQPAQVKPAVDVEALVLNTDHLSRTPITEAIEPSIEPSPARLDALVVDAEPGPHLWLTA